MIHEPELSIVMATYNRSVTLQRTLRHLNEQTLEPDRFELIVVDDASPDDTANVVKKLESSCRFRITFLRNKENKGPGYTQNRGIEQAVAPLLMIMTDDVWMAPNALQSHIRYHEQYSDVADAALGQVIQSPELNQTALLRNWDPFRFWQLEPMQMLPFYMFWACHVSCKREFMKEFGMFKEHRGRGGPVAFEDLEVGYRLGKHGMRLRYLDSAVAEHYHEYSMDGAEQRWYERGLNFDQLREHVPDPVLVVYFHVLNHRTIRDYARCLREPNPFRGKEKKLSWHLFRHGVQSLVLNRVTRKLFWKPFLIGAEKSALIESLATRHVYRAYFYSHFLRGVRDSYSRF